MFSDNQTKEIYQRLVDITHAKSDAALARDIGVSPQALSNFKNENRWPTTRLLDFCKKHGISREWLLLGTGFPLEKDVQRKEEVEIEAIVKHLKANPHLRSLLYAFVTGSVSGERMTYQINSGAKADQNAVLMRLKLSALDNLDKGTGESLDTGLKPPRRARPRTT